MCAYLCKVRLCKPASVSSGLWSVRKDLSRYLPKISPTSPIQASGPLSSVLTAVIQVNFSNSSKCSTFFTLVSAKEAQLQWLPLWASLGEGQCWITPDNRENRIVTGQDSNAETLDSLKNHLKPIETKVLLAQHLWWDGSGGHLWPALSTTVSRKAP